MKKSINKISLLLISFFLFPAIFHAGSIGANFSGNGNYKPGDTVSLNIYVGSCSGCGATDANGQPTGKINMFGGFVNYDSSCLAYQSITGHNGWSAQLNSANNKIAVADYSLNAGVSNSSIATITFKALKDCKTTVSMSGTSASDTAGNVSVGFSGKSIVIYTPSSNNNLSSLTVTPGGINFNGGTNYQTSVGASTTSVTVSAAAQDAKAKISGAGSYNLSYGDNNINVVVTAENGAKKTYTIKVNRKDDRSSNNNLASLNVSNGKLNPGFSKGNTKYSMEVPFETSKLKISATAEDQKSTVSISNPDLVAEETTTVSVKVTAENGSSKTYTISVKRGKDPNKPLSNNNYLDDLSVNVGLLSPSFNKEKNNYAVYLPFEISHIDIYVHQEDTKYATIKSEGNPDLIVGNNLFKYTLTAEDGSTRVYTLTVVRNKSLDETNLNSNVYLKKLELSNGKLIKKFDKKSNVIYYKKKNSKVAIKIAEPEEKDNIVQTYKLNKSFVIIVESPSGERNFYLLVEKSSLVIYIVALLAAIILLSGLIIYKLKKNNKKVKIDKPKKEKKQKKNKKIKELN